MTAVLRSEWTKLWSVTSIRLTLAAAFLTSVGLGWLSGWSIGGALDRGQDGLAPGADMVDAGLASLLYGNIAFFAFAVLVVTSEYGSGTIRSSLAAVPHRGLFYGCKIAVVGVVLLLVGTATAFTSFLVTEAALGRHGVGLNGESLGPVLGAAGYVVLFGVFAAGLAAMLRRTALVLGLVIPLYFLAPLLGSLPVIEEFARYLPDQAGAAMMSYRPAQLSPAEGALVLAAWAAVAVAGGYSSMRWRDA